MERFNRTYQTKVLDLYVFNNQKHVTRITEQWDNYL
ncbi:hypothetical protein [uncultured Gilliamella sp.]